MIAFSLYYYNGDYTPIGGASITPAMGIDYTNTTLNSGVGNELNLYNGNIRFMQTTLTDIPTGDALPMLNAYKYDQLNRLLEARSYTDGLSSNIWSPTSYDDKYFNAFTYDANGNILTQKRRNSAGTMLDDLTYHYQLDDFGNLVRNRLYNVNDAAGFQNAGDLTNQGTFFGAANQINLNNNYVYDEEGRLIKDVAEGIELIVWRVDGKVKEIHRHEDFEELKNLSFDYDAFGRRIAKHVYDNLWNLEKSTYYILDAQGNQLSVYEHVPESETPYELTERVIYGSARIGSQVQKIDLLDTEPEELLSLTLGEKHYFMSNHLGNILTVINDIKVPYLVGTDVAYYATIVSTADYSPFGVQLDVRTTENQAKWGFQGQETDNEIKGAGNSVNYTYRMHDPRLGRFFAVDPLAFDYPFFSAYAFSGNRVIDCRELEGLEPINATDSNGESLFKPKYRLNLPNGQQIVIYANAQGCLTMTHMDRNNVSSFMAQGFSQITLNDKFSSTRMTNNGETINFIVGLGGISRVDSYGVPQVFVVATIQVPSIVTITRPVQGQGYSIGRQTNNQNLINARASWAGRQLSRDFSNSVASIDINQFSEENPLIITVDMNDALTPEESAIFQQSFISGFQQNNPDAVLGKNVQIKFNAVNMGGRNNGDIVFSSGPQVGSISYEQNTLTEVDE